jgi:hypothetical protein
MQGLNNVGKTILVKFLKNSVRALVILFELNRIRSASGSRGSRSLSTKLRIPAAETPPLEFVLFETLVRVCSNRCAPRRVHCICCFLTNRLLTTWLIADSTKAVLIVSPCRYLSPKFGMNSWLLATHVSNSPMPWPSLSAAGENARRRSNSMISPPNRSSASSALPCQSKDYGFIANTQTGAHTFAD